MYISHDLMVLFVSFLRLFQELLTLAVDMMDDGDDIVMESPREDSPSLDAIVNVSTKICMLCIETYTCLSCGIMWLFSIVYSRSQKKRNVV